MFGYRLLYAEHYYKLFGLVQVEAEEFPEISLKFEIAAVPTFIFIKVMLCNL